MSTCCPVSNPSRGGGSAHRRWVRCPRCARPRRVGLLVAAARPPRPRTSVALAVRADPPRAGEGRLLRAPPAARHRPLGRSRRPSCRGSTRAREGGRRRRSTHAATCHAPSAALGGRAPSDARRAAEGRAALERPRLLGRLRHGARDGARPADHRDRRQERLADVRALPTRCAQFTCVHSLGHALMRGYHETLFLAVHACKKLGAALRARLRAGRLPRLLDLAARRRRDDRRRCTPFTRREACAPHTRASRCSAGTATGSSRRPGPVVLNAATCSLCRGLTGGAARRLHRGRREGRSTTRPSRRRGCARGCTRRRCARVPARRRQPGVCRAAAARARVLRRLPAHAAPAGCAAWFGRTFNVVENGRFRCPRARSARACRAPGGGSRSSRSPELRSRTLFGASIASYAPPSCGREGIDAAGLAAGHDQGGQPDDPRLRGRSALPATEPWEFFCECGCFTLVSLTLAEFDARTTSGLTGTRWVCSQLDRGTCVRVEHTFP